MVLFSLIRKLHSERSIRQATVKAQQNLKETAISMIKKLDASVTEKHSQIETVCQLVLAHIHNEQQVTLSLELWLGWIRVSV